MNNTQLVRDFISNHPKWNPGIWYYMLQVIQRSKDGHGKSTRTLKVWYIDSELQFNEILPTVIELCITKNARAYFNLNPKSYRKTALILLKKIADKIAAEHYASLQFAYESAAGLCPSEFKTWIIDYDSDSQLPPIEKIEEMIAACRPDGTKVLLKIPTKNGIHIITSPLDVQGLGIHHKDFIHKNNPTLLYCP
jgi:hypothetical protein